jgi:predicted nucleic acid-binding protein
MKNIYLDTCIVIYIVEKHHIFSPQIENLMNGLSQAEYFFSPLTQMESIIMPLRTKDLQLQKLYKMFLKAQTFLPMPKEVFENAAQIRADFPSLKTPDALHLATTTFHNCDEFWTNDNRLDKIAPNLVKNIL